MPYRNPRQAQRSTVMSAAVALQGVTVEAPDEMRQDVGSDLVFPLFLGRVGRTTPTVWTFCPQKALWQTGVVHATHIAEHTRPSAKYAQFSES